MKKTQKELAKKRRLSDKISIAVRAKLYFQSKKNLKFRKIFAKKYKQHNTGCFLWQGSTDHKGYGRIMVGGKPYAAHRVAFIISKGTILEGMSVCHTCGNPSCINPQHLVLGTTGQNARYRLIARADKVPDDIQKKILTLYNASYAIEDIADDYATTPQVVKIIIARK